MEKYIKFVIYIIPLLWYGENEAQATSGASKDSICLFDHIYTYSAVKPDAGGSWALVSGNNAIEQFLVGDNPCINFTELDLCGDFFLKYKVESKSCAGCFAENVTQFTICCSNLFTLNPKID